MVVMLAHCAVSKYVEWNLVMTAIDGSLEEFQEDSRPWVKSWFSAPVSTTSYHDPWPQLQGLACVPTDCQGFSLRCQFVSL